MVERIERIMRIKRLRFDSDELFERRKGFEEREKDESFAAIYEDEIEKKKHRDEDSNDAYHLDVGRPTQSLFYKGKVDLSDVKGKLHHAG